jgi:Helix-turn-helix domain
MNAGELLKVAGVSALLRVPSSWVYARTCESNSVGEVLPHLKLGRHLRFRRVEVERWVEGHHRGAEPTGKQPEGELQ